MPSHHARTKNQNENGLLQPIIMFLLFSTFYIIIPLMMFTYIIARTVYYCIIIILSGVLYNLNTTNKTNFIEATSQNYQDNEYWLNRCSICFDRKHEFCLNRCRDQFCKNCFSRYVQEVVNNSWGLNVTNVTCPVCRDVLPLKEWSKHVDTQTVKLYKTYNQPFRPLIRFCGSCQKPCFEPYVEYDEDIKTGKELLKKLKISYKEILAMMQLNRTQISYYNKEFKATYHYLHEGLTSEGVWHYTEVMDTIKHLSNDCDPSITQSEDFINLVTDFSVELISAESKADIWKKLQFLHISLIPNVYCIECEAPVCLKCTAASHHIGSTCIEYLEQLSVSRTSVKDSKATLKWMVDNSKSCPSCHILIQREEGCNKVNCLYCGGEFCWICMRQWTDGCGFYRCGGNQTNPSMPEYRSSSPFSVSSNYPSSETPELGIPDVKTIQAKFIGQSSSSQNLRHR